MVALRAERVGRQVDSLLWSGIALGLLFTTVNVQRFAAAGAPTFSTTWWSAWLLDPMVSLVLLAVIRAEQLTSRQQLPPSTWARITKWTAFIATYVMNTWEAWGLDGGPPSPAGVILYSIPPLLVLLAAETGPGLREQLARAAAASGRADRPDADPPADKPVLREPAVRHERSHNDVHESGDGVNRESPNRPSSSAELRSHGAGRSPRRRLLDDYLAEARAALSAATATGEAPTVTPSWCRAATGCSAGTPSSSPPRFAPRNR